MPAETEKITEYSVTLPWGLPGHDQGDYSTTVSAINPVVAVLDVAIEMADSGEVELKDEVARQEFILRLVNGPNTVSVVVPKPSVKIYTAIQFSGESEGLRTYETFYVAATSNEQAMEHLKEDGVWGHFLYLNNLDGHGRGRPVYQASKRQAETTIKEADFQLWVANGTRENIEDGEKYAPNWVPIPFEAPQHSEVRAEHAGGAQPRER